MKKYIVYRDHKEEAKREYLAWFGFVGAGSCFNYEFKKEFGKERACRFDSKMEAVLAKNVFQAFHYRREPYVIEEIEEEESVDEGEKQ